MAQHETERRATYLPAECRSASEGKPRVIEGYAAVFGTRSLSLGPQAFTERVSDSFFNKSNGDGWPGCRALYDHKSEYLLCRRRSTDANTDPVGSRRRASG
jgi:uncharacterized protein